MNKENYLDLLEALAQNTDVIILAVIQNDRLIDWIPASEYCTILEARSDHDWPQDAEISLLYGLDALLRYSNPSVLFEQVL